MHFIRTSLLVLGICSEGFLANAQEFGGSPPSIRWHQVNTDTVRVIFPQGLDSIALSIAGFPGKLGMLTQSTIGKNLRKINIVLQDQTTISNAYVALGPYRSEFYLTPEQNSFDLGSIPWYQSLVLHEYRHVQQFNNFRIGVSKMFYFLAGELGQSFANSAAIPNWFWEGDAVFQETLLSRQGRGRLASFFDGYRSLWASGKNYTWMKLRNGSLRDYIPDHYRLGYMLAAYGREKYGSDFWRKVTNDAARFRGLIYPFQRAIKKFSGEEYSEFRKDALQYFRSQSPQSLQDSNSILAAESRHFRFDEEFPQWVDANNILFVKSSYKRVPAFIIKNTRTGKEKLVRIKDISLDNYFSYRNGQIVYAAFQPDIRWGWRDFNDIRVVDVSRGGQRTITRHSKYFAPDISADGSRVVAVWVDPGGRSSLHVLNAGNGEIITKLVNPNNYFFTYPKFLDNDRIVTAARNADGEMALLAVHIHNAQIDELVPFSMNVIGYPQVNSDTISFSASYGGRDGVFLLIKGKLFGFNPANINRITGNYQLSCLGNQFAWTAFSSAGQSLFVDYEGAKKLQSIEMRDWAKPLPDFNIAAIARQGHNLTDSANLAYPVLPYSKSHRLFHFHSWLPDINDPEYSISLLGENILNTLQSEIYFTYNTNEKSKQMGFLATYGAWFPWIRLGSDYTIDRRFDFNNKSIAYDAWESYTGLTIPLDLSSGRYYRFLRFTTDYVYNKSYVEKAFKDSFNTRGFGYLRPALSFSNQVQKARQHIYPRWAQTLQVNAYASVSRIKGNQVMASAYWYFPGIDINHNLVINTAFHLRDTLRNVNYSNSFPFSRGYIVKNFHEMAKLGANYHFPIIYPDWGFGSIVYFLRIRGNLFFDYTRIMDYNSARKRVELEYRSYGAEVYFDSKWWNQHPVSFGVRYSRLLDGDIQGLGANQFEFVLPINLLQR